MITFDTKRMTMVAEKLSVVNGKIEEDKEDTDVPLWELKPNTSKCFNFYDKNNLNELICHIGFRHDRKPMEISYGTEQIYQKHGYMKEALSAFIKWYFENTNYTQIHALISNNDASKHILESNGFVENGMCNTSNMATWYVLKKA